MVNWEYERANHFLLNEWGVFKTGLSQKDQREKADMNNADMNKYLHVLEIKHLENKFIDLMDFVDPMLVHKGRRRRDKSIKIFMFMFQYVDALLRAKLILFSDFNDSSLFETANQS